ncbi:MAG: PPC domain-containing protein, partial [Anaerolineaceae bacterium]|nr:PPC domain-containing protein [Anaerolineaceae bacterium]
LTSPPIVLPSGSSYLRFAYFADVENGNPYWDQRWLQISDGGLFKDLYQFSDDKQTVQEWLNSGPVDLSAYAGKTIRLRFHFDTIDEDYNLGAGWMVDDINISSQGPDTSCADSDKPDASAPLVAFGSGVTGVICPERDIDYFRLSAKAGQNVRLDVNARNLTPASQLDSHIYLLDPDGRSVIAENDDEPGGATQDSLLSYMIQRDGIYFVKLKAWDYPGAGSTNHYYQIMFSQDQVRPPSQVQITYPTANHLAPGIPFTITAAGIDVDGGSVAKISFYWHGPNWSKPEWVKLGTDTNGSDGWSFPVDPALYGGVKGSAVYAQAVSQSGGILGTVIWDLQLDQTTPVSQLEALPGQTNSSVALIKWKASDAANDIDHFELQFQVNTGSGWSGWQNWTGRVLPGSLRSTWFTGTRGASYRLRMRAVDRAGNIEAYPDTPEAATTFSSTCSPDPSEAQGQTLAVAIPVTRSQISGTYNLCSAVQPGTGDVDWVSLSANQGEELTLMLLPRGGGAAFVVSIYNSSQQKLGTWQSVDYGNSLGIKWKVPSNGTYYLEIKPLQPDLFGTDALYRVWYGPGNWYYMPNIGN